MFKKLLSLAAFAGGLLGFAYSPAHAAATWTDWPGIGYASYCASTVSGVASPANAPYLMVPGSTQGTGQSICAQIVPAGPTAFAGTEFLPLTISALGSTNNGSNPQQAVVQLVQLGQGPMVDLTTVATTQTIPNLTPWYFLDGAQSSALTVTMPPAPIEGQIQHVVCEAATVGVLTVAANTGQTLKNNPNAACVAGVGYRWRYSASNTTWYSF